MSFWFRLGTWLVGLGGLAGWLSGPVTPVSAAPRFNLPRQVTTNPGEDFAPSLSADGRILVYVSDQSGNLDLWLKRLEPGPQTPDRRLTFHSSEDNSPAISPDGRWMAFVSNRSDPKGDIYLLPLDLGKEGESTAEARKKDEQAQALTDVALPESDPVWSPDQKYIYFTSTDPETGRPYIYRLKPGNRNREKVSKIPAVNPALSPDGTLLVMVARGDKAGLWAQNLKTGELVQLTDGQWLELSPRIAPDGQRLYFTRYQDDTNEDGRVSIDDQPNLWSLELKGGRPGPQRQLTDSSTYDLQPVAVGDGIYFTSTTRTGTDVWRLDPDGLLPRSDQFGQELQTVEDLCADYGERIYRCLLADNALVHDFAGNQALARILYRQARGYQALGQLRPAARIYQRIIRSYPGESRYRGLAEIELILIEVARSRAGGQAASREAHQQALERLDQVKAAYPEVRAVAARALLEQGHAQFALEDFPEALARYQQVIDTYPEQRPLAAEAAFSRSRVFESVGDQDNLIRAFVQVVRDFYDVERWTRRAIGRILEIHERHPTLNKKISSLNKLAGQYQELPRLAAAVQNRIGELYYQAGENLLAKEAYRATVDRYPSAAAERTRARFALASIYSEEENFEMSLAQYQAVEEDSGPLQSALEEARRGYIRKSIEKGEWELRVGEVKLARKTFLKLIDFAPETVEAHRGYVQAEAALKRIPEAIRFYQQRLDVPEPAPEDQYALGLAYTYLDPPDLDQAQKWIQSALVQNANVVFFHQTMGWVFEQRERRNPEGDYLERAVQEYQTALVLNDPEADPRNEANLMLNLGNGHYALNNLFTAYLFYDQRLASGLDFLDPRREILFYQRFGESAFKTGNPERAVELLKKSLRLLGPSGPPARRAELNDRIALAYQDAGRHAEAVEYFSRTLELHRQTGNTVSMARTLRNIANNLYALNDNRPERDSQALNQALRYYFDAIEKLEAFGVVRRAQVKKGSGGGLVDVSVEAGVDADSSQAALGFNEAGERKLIFHFIGRIFGDFGDYDQAIAYFRKKLDMLPARPDPQQQLPLLLEKALLLNQIGHYHYLAGRLDQSKTFFQQSYALSRQMENRMGVGVNASNLGRILILQTRSLPFARLKEEFPETLALLEEAARMLDAEPDSLPQPEFRVYIKNDLALLHHYLAWLVQDSRKASGDPVQAVQGALAQLDQAARHSEQSIRYFQEALAAADNLPEPARGRLRQALERNLELARHLAGRPAEKAAPASAETLPGVQLFAQWQMRFFESLEAPDAGRRLEKLQAADAALSALPFGYPRGPGHLPMIEDLYQQLALLLFDQDQLNEALHYVDMGGRQLLLARLGQTPLRFEDETRQALFGEVMSFTRDLESMMQNPGEEPESVLAEADALMQEYDEFLQGVVAEEDPDLLWMVAPAVPEVQEVQDLLGSGTVLLRYEWIGDRLLLWWLDGASVQGASLPVPTSLRARIERLVAQGAGQATPEDLEALSRALLEPVRPVLSQARSLILIAGGPLEFLPWAALPLEGQPLIQKLSLTYQASLTQLVLSERRKNLYNSRLLAVEWPEETFQQLGPRFASAENLVRDDAGVEAFSRLFAHYGVVSVATPSFLAGLDLERTYIGLTARERHYERLDLPRLWAHPVDSHFLALENVAFRFSPEVALSPAVPLLMALTQTGFPGVLMHRGAVDPKQQALFRTRFFETFRKGNPAESLRQAQLALARETPGRVDWADYRYYGFPGMTEEEKNEFARERYAGNLQAGARAFEASDWLTAIDRFERALVLIDFLEDRSQKPQLNKLLAQAAYNHGDFKKAIRYQSEVLDLARRAEDPEQTAEAHYFLGILFSRDEAYDRAVDHLKQALKFYQEYEILDKLAESYSTLGIIEENALDYDGALQAFQASIQLHEEMGEDLNRGRELRRIGRIYLLRLNDYPKAWDYFSAANTLFQSLDVPEQTAESWLEMGQAAEKQSRFDDALALYRKAQALAEEQDLKLQLSKAFLFQGNTEWFQGNYQNAFRFQKQALALAEEMGHTHQQVLVYNTLGLIYWTLNDSRRALSHLKTSLELAESIPSPLDVASAYNNMGLVHRKDGNYEKSIELFQEALKRDEQLKSKWGQGYTHRNLGISYLRMNRLEEAETHLQRAVALSTEIGNNTNLVKAKLELGNLALARKQCRPALDLFRETAGLAERFNIKEVLWRALRGQGVCLNRLGRLADAIAAYQQAVGVVDGMRAAIKVEEFQNGFLTDKQDVYKELVLLLLESGKAREAFETAERAKARSFIDLLGNQKITLKDDISRDLYRKLTAQKRTIRELEERLARTEGEEAVRRAQADLVEARNTYQDLLIEAKEQSPQLSSFVTVESISLKRLQTLLKDKPEVALVEYLMTEEELVAWVISRDRLQVTRTPVREPELVAMIKDYRYRIQHLAPLEELSRRLYDLILRPVAPLLRDFRVVGIIPHSHLHYLSFASLYDGEAYWIERHPLFFSPSASVLEYTFQRQQSREGPVRVLAMGNPDLGTLNYDLPLAELEANSIRWDFPEVTVLTRERARESWLQEHISEYQVIHIASHGEFDSVNPLFSALKLARDEKADGNFEVNEVFALDIQADLVTLSACQTGLGEITGGDELVGLNRAFIYAGTHAIVSSLWRVSDISTAVLIKHFYRNYTKQNKGESLRQAQLQVRRLYPHPSYWAGFILTGDYR